MSKHSSGPWDIDGNGKVMDANGELVAILQTSRWVDERNDPQCLANNTLMAAAPELLETLEQIKALSEVHCVDDVSRREKLASIFMLAANVISKATP